MQFWDRNYYWLLYKFIPSKLLWISEDYHSAEHVPTSVLVGWMNTLPTLGWCAQHSHRPWLSSGTWGRCLVEQTPWRLLGGNPKKCTQPLWWRVGVPSSTPSSLWQPRCKRPVCPSQLGNLERRDEARACKIGVVQKVSTMQCSSPQQSLQVAVTNHAQVADLTRVTTQHIQEMDEWINSLMTACALVCCSYRMIMRSMLSAITGLTICIAGKFSGLKIWRICLKIHLVGFLIILTNFSENLQTAKLKTLPNFPAIRYTVCFAPYSYIGAGNFVSSVAFYCKQCLVLPSCDHSKLVLLHTG